ncbi:MAG: HEPN domain-containing protein [Treponema sp.]|nr:HEPN domain-containing protein [Treponema sp.]
MACFHCQQCAEKALKKKKMNVLLCVRLSPA